jgi:hypothetical protein
MYRRPILCTLYMYEFLKCSEEGLLGGWGVLLEHNEIHYVPLGDGWEEVLVLKVLKTITYEVSSKTNATPPISQSRDVWRINLIKYNTKIGQFPSTLFFIICF